MEPENLANFYALTNAGRRLQAQQPNEAQMLAQALMDYGSPRQPDSSPNQQARYLSWALMNYQPQSAGDLTEASPGSDQSTSSPASAGLAASDPGDGQDLSYSWPTADQSNVAPDEAAVPAAGGDGAPDTTPPGSAQPGDGSDAQLVPVADVRLADRFAGGLPPNPNTPQSWNDRSSPDGQPYIGGFQLGPSPGGDVPSDMSPSDKLTAFIKSRELGPTGGPALKPYGSIEGGTATIGWGHKIKPGEDFSQGITRAEAEEIFQQDLRDAQNVVRRNVTAPLTQGQFDAMTSLAWNRPAAARDVAHDLNRGDYAAAAQKFSNYQTAKGAIKPGLTERRGAEQDMFLTGIYDDKL